MKVNKSLNEIKEQFPETLTADALENKKNKENKENKENKGNSVNAVNSVNAENAEISENNKNSEEIIKSTENDLDMPLKISNDDMTSELEFMDLTSIDNIEPDISSDIEELK